MAILLIFFTRYNAVRLYMYEDYMIVEFYLIKKEIKVNYNQVKEALMVSNRYEGINIRFKIIIDDKKYTFRINKFDTEFTDFLQSKVNYRISKNI
ncbi:hypothetical protein B8T70_21150 [Flavobacterium sp. AJR]|nr:hypothetical protein B8T70_21150 [Flavobacterium sp. AJR]